MGMPGSGLWAGAWTWAHCGSGAGVGSSYEWGNNPQQMGSHCTKRHLRPGVHCLESSCSAASSQLKKGQRFRISLKRNIVKFLIFQNLLTFKTKSLPEPIGVRAPCATIGEIVGEMRPAGDDLSGNSGLVMLPRLQSRKQPCWMGLDEN